MAWWYFDGRTPTPVTMLNGQIKVVRHGTRFEATPQAVQKLGKNAKFLRDSAQAEIVATKSLLVTMAEEPVVAEPEVESPAETDTTTTDTLDKGVSSEVEVNQEPQVEDQSEEDDAGLGSRKRKRRSKSQG